MDHFIVRVHLDAEVELLDVEQVLDVTTIVQDPVPGPCVGPHHQSLHPALQVQTIMSFQFEHKARDLLKQSQAHSTRVFLHRVFLHGLFPVDRPVKQWQ